MKWSYDVSASSLEIDAQAVARIAQGASLREQADENRMAG
jgi:hypothetical protein